MSRGGWKDLKQLTAARIGLERSGHALATRAVLDLQLAHARARDAVWRPWDFSGLAEQLGKRGEKFEVLHTQVSERSEYLRRPDLGRRLALASAARLTSLRNTTTAFIVSDGLSAEAIETQFLPFWTVFSSQLKVWTYAPLLLVPFSRVAVSDEIGERLGVDQAVIFIGERPGLSASDSMGVYLTYQPRLGNHDAQRNCLSNIRSRGGMSYELAAAKLMFLLRESLRLRLSGTRLKEDASLDWSSKPQLGD